MHGLTIKAPNELECATGLNNTQIRQNGPFSAAEYDNHGYKVNHSSRNARFAALSTSFLKLYSTLGIHCVFKRLYRISSFISFFIYIPISKSLNTGSSKLVVEIDNITDDDGAGADARGFPSFSSTLQC